MTNVASITGRVLIIEDEVEVNNAINDALLEKGFYTKQEFDGKEGLVTALSGNFNLIMIDKMLPSMDGIEVLNKLRKHKDTPVLMLTACGAEEDRITGFHTGADDYVPKPFYMTELLLRVETLIRRYKPDSGVVTKDSIQIGLLNFDNTTKTITLDKEFIKLTPLEYDLLHTLVDNSEEVLSKAYLYQLVLKKPFSRYDRSLDVHVSNLRSKLSILPANHPNIKTVHGKGYGFY